MHPLVSDAQEHSEYPARSVATNSYKPQAQPVQPAVLDADSHTADQGNFGFGPFQNNQQQVPVWPAQSTSDSMHTGNVNTTENSQVITSNMPPLPSAHAAGGEQYQTAVHSMHWCDGAGQQVILNPVFYDTPANAQLGCRNTVVTPMQLALPCQQHAAMADEWQVAPPVSKDRDQSSKGAARMITCVVRNVLCHQLCSKYSAMKTWQHEATHMTIWRTATMAMNSHQSASLSAQCPQITWWSLKLTTPKTWMWLFPDCT